MNITFADRKLRKLSNNDAMLFKKYGSVRAEKLRLRLKDLMFADSLEDTRHLPGNYHELKNNRKGQWACDLDQPYRLVFKPHEHPIPIDNAGQYIWKEITGVEILGIFNYHKEK